MEMATSVSEIVSKIVFENNPQKVCYSGQLLKGSVKLFFPSTTCVQAIYIKFVGEGFYSWVEDVNDREVTGTTQYLVQRMDLVTRSNAGSNVSAGSNQYPFEIQLPHHLPTSFEGKYGHIRYTLALCLAPLGLTSDPVPIVETFTVIKPLNLNSSFAFVLPVRVSQAAQFNFGFTRLCVLYRWRKGYLKIFGLLPVSGYCPGQIMNLQLDVINESGQGVLMMVVHFIQEVTYIARGGMKKIETIILIRRKIKGFRGEQICRQSKKINLTVPAVPPTSFQSANDVCAFKYLLRVTAVTGLWLEDDPILDIPVTIGTSPITNEVYNSVACQSIRRICPSAPVEEIVPSAPYEPVHASAPAPAFESEFTSGPPPYDEAMRLPENYEFTPNYPIYSEAMLYCSENFEYSSQDGSLSFGKVVTHFTTVVEKAVQIRGS